MGEWHRARVRVDGVKVMEKEPRPDLPKPADLDGIPRIPESASPRMLTHHQGDAW